MLSAFSSLSQVDEIAEPNRFLTLLGDGSGRFPNSGDAVLL